MEELDLKELFTMFWNKKVQIILIIAIFVVIGVIYTIGFVTPVYTSTTTLVLAGQTADNNDTNTTTDTITSTDLTLNSKLVGTYSKLVTSDKVVRQVISNLGIDVDVEDLKKNISVTSVEDTELIEISVTNENPTYAMKIANEIVELFKEQVAEIYNINNVHVVDAAEEEVVPSNVNHTKDVIIFAFIGIVVAGMYVLVTNMLDTTIKSREEIEKLYKVPVLAEIPFNTEEKGGRK